MKYLKKNIKIVSEDETSNSIKIYDRNGNDIIGKMPVERIELDIRANMLNKAVLTLCASELDINAKAIFQLENGWPVIDFLKTLKSLMGKYREFKEEQLDETHAHCLDDFYQFALESGISISARNNA